MASHVFPGFAHTGVVTSRRQRVTEASLLGGDLAHGVAEGEAEHAHAEVNGVAGRVAFGPAPGHRRSDGISPHFQMNRERTGDLPDEWASSAVKKTAAAGDSRLGLGGAHFYSVPTTQVKMDLTSNLQGHCDV